MYINFKISNNPPEIITFLKIYIFIFLFFLYIHFNISNNPPEIITILKLYLVILILPITFLSFRY
jgi:hypothetical protein